MITARTCLVLGAGASAPYGLPPARALRDLILVQQVADADVAAERYAPAALGEQFTPSARKHEGFPKMAWGALLNKRVMGAGCSHEEIQNFRAEFFASHFPSVDKFLQANEARCGRAGLLHIATVLLACEELHRLDKNWYSDLLQAITPEGPTDLKEGMLSVVTFNYDRSFERFFLDAFRFGFNVSDAQAHNIFDRIDVVHAYGQLGDLGRIPYGSLDNISKAVEGISLARTGRENPNRDRINKMLKAAENICFIGFSFAPENTEIFDLSVLKEKKMIATSIGMSGAREAEVRKLFRGGIKFFDGTAEELLNSRNIFQGARSKPATDHLTVKRRPIGWMRDELSRGWKI